MSWSTEHDRRAVLFTVAELLVLTLIFVTNVTCFVYREVLHVVIISHSHLVV